VAALRELKCRLGTCQSAAHHMNLLHSEIIRDEPQRRGDAEYTEKTEDASE
jgi:hypothetical protein